MDKHEFDCKQKEAINRLKAVIYKNKELDEKRFNFLYKKLTSIENEFNKVMIQLNLIVRLLAVGITVIPILLTIVSML